jgi:glycosyltransferase involved in cell wall biosynthesis
MPPFRPRVCFFAKVPSRAVLDRVEFYAQDLAMLDAVGFDVHVATRTSEIRPADLYFAWWWTWAFVPLLHPFRRGAPVVVTGTFDWWNFPTRPVHERALLRYALRAAAANVFHSQRECAAMAREAVVTRPLHIPPAIDTARYRPAGQRDGTTIFTLATMRHWNAQRKSIPELIRAAPLVHAERPDVRFVIAGDYEPAYPALAAEVGASDYITFPGILSTEAKIRHMQTCAVYLQPSRFEGFGVAIAEALACGAPVVTSAVGEVPDVVGDAARFVDGTDPSDIARGVLDTLAAVTDGGTPTAGRARIAARFSVEQHRARWANLLVPLVAPSRGGAMRVRITGAHSPPA